MAQTDVRPLSAPEREAAGAPDISVVVTLLNEAATLDELYERTTAALEELGRPYELIFVDDGSTDGTFAALERLHARDERVRAVRFKRSFGQHPAMHAGLARARAEIVVTMDGDLQNRPEDLPLLVEAVDAGYDVASGRRSARRDSWGRTLPSRLINGMLRRFTGVPISDFGCAFNAYRRSAVELGLYGVWYWVDRGDFPGPLFGGTAIVFVLGVQGFILALVGEYLGRIQREVERRPLYTIEREL